MFVSIGQLCPGAGFIQRGFALFFGFLHPIRFAVRVPHVELAIAIALRPPQQTAIFQEAVIVAEVDPVILARSLFGEPHFAVAGCRIDLEHIEHGLLAVLALDINRAAVGRPIDPRDIDVGVVAQIDLDLVAAIGVHHKQLDNRIVAARDRIALVVNLGPRRADGGAGDDADGALVGALDNQTALIGCPPVSGEAAHFLLSHELGLAPADRVAFLGRDRRRLFAEFADPQLPLAHERCVALARRQRRIKLAFLGIGQAGHLAVELGEIEIAIQRHEHARPVARPLIGDDPRQPTDPRALALHLLVFGQFAPAAQLLAVDQHRPFAAVHLKAPQVITLRIVFAVAQDSEVFAIGRQFRLARCGAVERRRGKNPLEGELLFLAHCVIVCDGRSGKQCGRNGQDR